MQGKVPVVPGWQNLDIGLLPLQRKAYPEALGTGLRTARIPSIDIDVRNPLVVKALVTLATECLGATPLHRVGAKGVMLVYSADEPFRKITISTGTEDKVEILGDGQQFVAFGIHPDTGKPYTWVQEDDFGEIATPLTIERDALPMMVHDDAIAFAQKVAAKFTDLGFENVKVSVNALDVKQRELDVDEDQPLNVDLAKRHIANLIERGEIAPGERDDSVYKLAALLRSKWYLSHDLIREMLLGDYAAKCVPTFTEEEIIAPMVHAIGSPDTDATSYMQNEPGATASLPASQAFSDALDKLPPELLTGEPEGSTTKRVFAGPICGDDYVATPRPPLRELVPTWIERGIHTILEGPGASQKSRSALQDAICVQAGIDVMRDCPVIEQSTVLYLNYENPHDEQQRRIMDIRKFLQRDNKSDLPSIARLHTWDLRDDGDPIIEIGRDGPVITEFGHEFIRFVKTRRDKGEHTLIVFDGLMDAIVFNENTRNDEVAAAKMLRIMDRWCVDLNATMQSIVHPSRSAERGGSVGSYATAWTTKPRAIQTFKRVLNPEAGYGPKAKITEDTPLNDIFYQRRVQKRSNGPEGARVLLEYKNGGLEPHLPARHTRSQPAPETEEPLEDTSDL